MTDLCVQNITMMCYLRIPKNVRETIKRMRIPVATLVEMEEQVGCLGTVDHVPSSCVSYI